MQPNFNPNFRPNAKMIVLALVVLILLVIPVLLFDVVLVEGNEYGVKETWGEGVLEDPLPPKTYILFPGFMQRIYKYDMSSRIFVMNDRQESTKVAAGRAMDMYTVQSKEGQNMGISMNLRWHIDPAKVVMVHKMVRHNIEEKLLRPEIMRIVKDEATTREAIVAYSGVGLVKLQADIFVSLSDPDGELRNRGVVVENFVIEEIRLDPEYVGEIKARQVAIQRELRAKEETKAALAMAEKVKAEAQAAYEKALVDARRDKDVGVLEFEKKAQQEVLAAEADAKKVELAAGAEQTRSVLVAKGRRDAAMLEAEAIEAVGAAEAEATRLKLSAYSVAGSAGFIRIEIAKHMAEGFKNISGYLPESMTVNVLSESFLKGVGLVVDPTRGGVKSAGQ